MPRRHSTPYQIISPAMIAIPAIAKLLTGKGMFPLLRMLCSPGHGQARYLMKLNPAELPRPAPLTETGHHFHYGEVRKACEGFY